MNKHCYVVLSVRDLNHLAREARKSRKMHGANLNHCIVVESSVSEQASGLQVASYPFRSYRAK